MQKKHDDEKHVKKGISVPAERWRYAKSKAGSIGVPSKVVAEALRWMEECERLGTYTPPPLDQNGDHKAG